MTRTLALGCFLLIPLSLAAQDKEQNALVTRKLSPSVVAIRNLEGWGSGMILDARGLILTNAHVVCSPLPFYIEALGTVGTETKTLKFQNVSLLGVHPEYDLALLQIDPAEHRATLKPVTTSNATLTAGDPLWAIGFPSDVNSGKSKYLTWGKVKATNKMFHGDSYIEMDVSLYFGNSGGPVCNANGEVVGVATAIAEGGNTLAVSIGLVKPEGFVALRQRAPNHKLSTMLIGLAEKEMDAVKKGRDGSLGLAIMYYQKALSFDAGNASLYAKIAQFNYAASRYDFAVAYYARSLQIQPWPDNGAHIYRELGSALVGNKKLDDAITTWKEGLRKYPLDNSQLWDDLAVLMMDTDNPLEAACSARTALKCFSNNPDAMNAVYKKAREKMPPEDMGKLREYENGLDAWLSDLRVQAEKARKDGKEFVTPEMEKLMQSISGVQQSGTIDLARMGFKRGIEKLNVTDSELTQLFVRSRVDTAGELLRVGKIEQAGKTLEDVIQTYPDHPETGYARDLLKLIRKQQGK
ncbi:MAG TPA: tetratricopeptide repeat-containing serine protease family protein [Planctomycetota bacterium]|nr:tetratricopeptide repeat-containing serine protease family protein [Planctomycetota bacterium]